MASQIKIIDFVNPFREGYYFIIYYFNSKNVVWSCAKSYGMEFIIDSSKSIHIVSFDYSWKPIFCSDS